jgi:SM-20-related protein
LNAEHAPTRITIHPASKMDLNPELDLADLQTRFGRDGRVLISNILRVDSALALNAYLSREQGWGLSMSANPLGRRFLDADGLQALGPSERDSIIDVAYSTGSETGSHLYETFSLANYKECLTPAGRYFADFLTFMNSDAFLALARTITSRDSITAETVVACRYQPGHFYSRHTDAVGGDGHVYSFVLNLNLRWDIQWGGLLQFTDDRGQVLQAFVPRFNSLSLFNAALPHSVSLVAPFAPLPRYSIAGALIT